MKLSEVPLAELINTPNFLTGANGTPGKILGITSHPSGKFFENRIHIQWATGKESFPIWPHECGNVTVDISMFNRCLKPYADSNIATLKTNINFYQMYVKDENGEVNFY